ncbi:MAG: vitamin K epoxide reductase family protein [Gemmatimonadetes bacterium]|nr:vitamin K epoxide reductase family protein [Gemmatimonadota bacterium]
MMQTDHSERNPAIYRQAIAVLAFLAGLIALYLHLVKVGTFGVPSCGPGGGCVAAWYSSWGSFLGIDVALIGAIGYGLLTVVALLGTRIDLENSPAVTNTILVLVLAAVAFTWRLKYGEWYVMGIFCVWCFESFMTIHLCLVLVLLDRRRLRRAG